MLILLIIKISRFTRNDKKRIMTQSLKGEGTLQFPPPLMGGDEGEGVRGYLKGIRLNRSTTGLHTPQAPP